MHKNHRNSLRSYGNAAHVSQPPVFSFHPKEIAVLAFFIIIGFAIYSNSLDSPFILDDLPKIVKNPKIRLSEVNPGNVLKLEAKDLLYRPFSMSTLSLNYYFNQYEVPGYHLVNIIIHILSGLALYVFFKTTLRLVEAKNDSSVERKIYLISFSAATLWFVNPLHTNSVTYIVQRMTSMASLFFVLSVLCFARGRISQIHHSSKHISFFWFSGCVLSGILALGSKEIAATLPFFIWFYEWYFFQGLNSSWLKKYIPLLVVLVAGAAVLGFIFLFIHPPKRMADLSDNLTYFSIPQRLITEFRVVIYYLSLIVFPHPSRLNFDRDYPLSLMTPPITALSMLAVFTLIVLAFFASRKKPLFSFGIIWYFGNLVIESSVIPLAVIIGHRTYLPSMVIILSAVIRINQFVKFKCIKATIYIISITVLSVWTYQRNMVWNTHISFWEDCVKKSPHKASAYHRLGLAVMDQIDSTPLSEKEKQKLIDDAENKLLKAIEFDPGYILGYIHISALLKSQGRIAEAIEYLKRSIRLKPSAEAHTYLGRLLTEKKEINNAIAHYKRALDINPNLIDPYINLGIILGGRGKYSQAVHYLKKSLQVSPTEEAYYNLGVLFGKQGNNSKAVKYYKKAIRINPNSLYSHYNLGILLNRQGNKREAAGHFQKVLQINPAYVEALKQVADTYIVDKNNIN